MTLAERCDEIVRLIDATLAEITTSDPPVPGRAVSPDGMPVARAVTAADSPRLRASAPVDPAA